MVTGKIERGVVKIGEEVDVIGLKAAQKTAVTGIEMFNKQLQEGQAGDNAGILLRGLKKKMCIAVRLLPNRVLLLRIQTLNQKFIF